MAARERKIGNSARNRASIASLTWRGTWWASSSRVFWMACSSSTGLPCSSQTVGLLRSLKSG